MDPSLGLAMHWKNLIFLNGTTSNAILSTPYRVGHCGCQWFDSAHTTLLEGYQALANLPSSSLVRTTTSALDSAPTPGVFDGSGYSLGRMAAWIFVHSR